MSRPTAVLASVLLALVVLQPAVPRARGVAVDFVQFWVVGLEAGTTNVYAEESREDLGRVLTQRADGVPDAPLGRAARYRSVLETYSSPALYAAFGAAATGDYDRDLAAYQRASLFAFVAGVLMLARAAGMAFADGALLAALLVAFSAPYASDQNVGNVVRLQVGLLGAAALLLARGTPRALAAAGVVLGAAVLFKPNVVLAALAPLLARLTARRPVKALGGGLVAGAALGLVVGAAWFGRIDAWSQWLEALPQMPAAIIRPEIGNWGLVSLVASRLGRGPALLLVSLPVLAATAGVLARDRSRPDVVALALGAVAWLLVSPLTWMTDYLLATPALAVAVAHGGVGRALGVAALVLMSTPHPALVVGTTPVTWCLVYFTAAALLYASMARSAPRTTPGS